MSKLEDCMKVKKDRGIAWLVCAASFFSHGLTVGFSYSVLGTLNLAQQKRFNISQTNSSWIISVHLCCFLLGAPICSVLIKKTSTRTIQLFGGCCVVTSLALCYLATQPWHVYLLFSVVAGFGLSCCYTASSNILGHYFDRHIYLASAIVIVGLYIGFCTFPLLSQYLVEAFGYNKAIAILSSFHLIHIIGGLSYREYNAEDNGSQEGIIDVTSDKDDRNAISPQNETTGKQRTTVNCVEKQNGEDNSMEEQDQEISSSEKQDREGNSTDAQAREVSSSQKTKTEVVSYENESPDIKLSKKDDENSNDNWRSNDKIVEHVKIMCTSSKMSPLLHFREFMHNMKAWSYVVCGFLWSLGSTSFFALIIDYITDKLSVTEQEAALGITVLAAGSIVGVLAVCSASQLRFNRAILHSVTAAVYGICSILIICSTTKVHYYTLTAIYGLGYGAQAANVLALAYDICGADQMVLLFGLEIAFEGLGGLIGSPLCSYIAESLGLQAGLILGGVSDIAASIVLLPVIIAGCRGQTDTYRNDDSNSSSHATKIA